MHKEGIYAKTNIIRKSFVGEVFAFFYFLLGLDYLNHFPFDFFLDDGPVHDRPTDPAFPLR